jgi:predicted O-methyltransferase YrrM
MSPAELQFLFEKAGEVKTILEIGSWKGRSTHALLSGVAPEGSVVAVDHFKGSKGEDIQHAEAKSADEPVYQEFMKNVGHFKNLEVMKMSSKEAKEALGDTKFDMIFIDGSHDYDSVKEDISLWKNNAKGLLCGHDFCSSWPGVCAAVDESLKKDGVMFNGSIWYKWM